MRTHNVQLTNQQIQDIITATLCLAGRLDLEESDDKDLMVRLLDINDHLWDSSNDLARN